VASALTRLPLQHLTVHAQDSPGPLASVPGKAARQQPKTNRNPPLPRGEQQPRDDPVLLLVAAREKRKRVILKGGAGSASATAVMHIQQTSEDEAEEDETEEDEAQNNNSNMRKSHLEVLVHFALPASLGEDVLAGRAPQGLLLQKATRHNNRLDTYPALLEAMVLQVVRSPGVEELRVGGQRVAVEPAELRRGDAEATGESRHGHGG